MPKRFLSLWFCHLTTDRLAIRYPELRGKPFVLAGNERGRAVVQASSREAYARGIRPGKAVADARAIFPDIQVYADKPGWSKRLLYRLAGWCLQYTPLPAADPPSGLMLDISGCPHLWGGESAYLEALVSALENKGYHVRAAIADTIGAAWALARYGEQACIAGKGMQREALLPLPPAALRLEARTLEGLEKLGFRQIEQFIDLPAATLRRRFGEELLFRLGQALGEEEEAFQPVQPRVPYEEQLPCLEPIRTARGIEIALRKLLEGLCQRLVREGKGLRKAVFKGLRIDGKTVEISIGTGRASHNPEHLFRLFALKIPLLEPALGIELFYLEGLMVEKVQLPQEQLWHRSGDPAAVAELVDRIGTRLGSGRMHRFLPQERHWPEHSVRPARSLDEMPDTDWPDSVRPLHLLSVPEPISVMVPLPDYPPLHFKHQGKLVRVARADGPERIEQEWWLQTGPPRDYYSVEDPEGGRYWLFRLGLYGKGEPQWFLHGYFS
ncbi:protein ImuB [Cyclobacterium lianum]|uniref:Protein ImuB n=1 Tax=Cyclobacterium lianum TaxID=388280 RepID=A0A1M7QPE7_9BACT|nr:DNA polymerase Y family protein [Cyclobacterium lianum]SHN33390.1 protein ImuB [Cyclobacterium lianum]